MKKIRIGSRVIYQGIETKVIGRNDTGFIIEYKDGWPVAKAFVFKNERYSKNVYIPENRFDAKHRGWHVHKKELKLVEASQ